LPFWNRKAIRHVLMLRLEGVGTTYPSCRGIPKIDFFMAYWSLVREGFKVDMADLYYDPMPELDSYEAVIINIIGPTDMSVIRSIRNQYQGFMVLFGLTVCLLAQDIIHYADAVISGAPSAILPAVLKKRNTGVINSPIHPESEEVERFYLEPPIEAYRYYKDRGYTRYHIMTSMGCPCNCSFCFRPAAQSQRMIFVSPDVVAQAIELMSAELGSVYFADDDFFAFPEHTAEVLRALEKHPAAAALPKSAQGTPYHRVFLGEGGAATDLTRIMVELGFEYIMFGLENFDPDVRARMGKHPDSLDVLPVLERIAEAELTAFGSYFMVGTPWETMESLKYTTQIIQKHRYMFTWPRSPLPVWKERPAIMLSPYIKLTSATKTSEEAQYKSVLPPPAPYPILPRQLQEYYDRAGICYAVSIYGIPAQYLHSFEALEALVDETTLEATAKPVKRLDRHLVSIELIPDEADRAVGALAIINNIPAIAWRNLCGAKRTDTGLTELIFAWQESGIAEEKFEIILKKPT
jgi:hypothetical protein